MTSPTDSLLTDFVSDALTWLTIRLLCTDMEHDLRCNDLKCRRLLASTDANAVVTSCSRQARQHNDAVLMLMLRRHRHLLWCIANLTSILLIIVLIVSRSDLRTSAIHDSTDMSSLR